MGHRDHSFSDIINATLAATRPQAMAALLRHFRDLDLAVNAHKQASLGAMQLWPRTGLPRDPLAWLVTTGRNTGQEALGAPYATMALPDAELLFGAGADMLDPDSHIPYRDDTLRLLYICCHRDLPPSHQMALALRLVAGMPLPAIAYAFQVREAAMVQRILRAKRRVSEEATPFDDIREHQRAERLAAVSTLIYQLFNEGCLTNGRHGLRTELCDEAIRMARLLARLYPYDSGTLGLAALLMLQHARAHARVDTHGALVPLAQQDRSRWDRALIAEAVPLAQRAANCKPLGPYQIQASVAVVHAQAASARRTDWAEIDRLYGVLETVHPSPFVTLNRAVAVEHLRGPSAALRMLEPLEQDLAGYTYYFSLRSLLFRRLGRNAEARAALQKARTLVRSAPVADHIDMTLNLI